MIKCLKCGDKFSYGRKICCCNSTYFGTIFIGNKKDHNWNCNIFGTKNKSYEPSIEEISELNIIEKEIPIFYNWNCETSIRCKNQKDGIEKDYVLIYE